MLNDVSTTSAVVIFGFNCGLKVRFAEFVVWFIRHLIMCRVNEWLWRMNYTKNTASVTLTLHLTLKMTTTEVVATSVSNNTNSPSQNFKHRTQNLKWGISSHYLVYLMHLTHAKFNVWNGPYLAPFPPNRRSIQNRKDQRSTAALKRAFKVTSSSITQNKIYQKTNVYATYFT